MTDIYYRIGLLSVLLSSITLFTLLTTLPALIMQFNNGKQDIETMANAFGDKAKFLWSQMLNSDISARTSAFSRVVRSPWGSRICRGCFQLACANGPIGPPGEAGLDGAPGEPGNQGEAGDDGYDIQLEPEPDLPCVICPAGPPGLRGHQGERGRPGNSGSKGQRGPSGLPGKEGPQGNPGSPGLPGLRGAIGPAGPPGDTTIAGVGIRGPKGPPGPMGMKGPTGPMGKASNAPGMPGRLGSIGSIGPPGKAGRVGDEGPWGPPGEPGEPAAYCPSDCGVSEIFAPAYIRTGKVDVFTGYDSLSKSEKAESGYETFSTTADNYADIAHPSAAESNSKSQSVAAGNLNDAWSKYLWLNKK